MKKLRNVKTILRPELLTETLPPDEFHLNRARKLAQERAIALRFTAIVGLGVSLLLAMQWAMTITDANTRQISVNLARMQSQFAQPTQTAQRPAPSPSVQARRETADGGGPTVDPAK